MTRHRTYRKVEADVREVITRDTFGNYDRDYNIQAVDGSGDWYCECGAGPFETKRGAKRHLSNNE